MNTKPLGTDPYIRAMFGHSAVQVPFHMVIQHQDKDIVLMLGACGFPGAPLRFGSKCCHQLFWGDAVFRPRGVWESDKFRGHGASGMITSSAFCDPEQWDRRIIEDGLPV